MHKTNDDGRNRQIDQKGLRRQPPPNRFRFRRVDSYQPMKGGYYWLLTGNKGAQGGTYYRKTAKERVKRGE